MKKVLILLLIPCLAFGDEFMPFNTKTGKAKASSSGVGSPSKPYNFSEITLSGISGAGGVPGGATTQLQYNNAGAFGGITGATTNGTVVTLIDPVTNNLTIAGDQSAPAWTTNGVKIKGVAGTLTDTTSSGNVAAAYSNVLGGNTIAATNATNFNTYITLYLRNPLTGTNVTFVDKYALGADTAIFGTSNPVTIAASGLLTATSPRVVTSLTSNSATFGLLPTSTTINAFSAATTLNLGASAATVLNLGGFTSAAELRFLEPSASGTNYFGIKAQAMTGNTTYLWPAADATITGQMLTSNALGTLSWTTPPTGGDFSSNTSSSVDSEVVLFSGTGGKTGKRASGTGIATLASGVLGTTTNNSTDWNTAFSQTRQWDGGATGLVAGTGRTSLGLGTLATQSGTFSGTSSGTNTGDQTSIVGITGTKAQFDTAATDGDFLYVGDVSQYTDELAQDAVGGMIDTSLTYVDATPLLQRAALTGAVTASAGSNTTALGSFTTAQFNTALSDNDVATGGGTASGTNTGDQTSVSGNAGTATALQNARNINGVSFNGTANITIGAALADITGLGSNVGTFLATPSSANLRGALTDENGTGVALFDGATSPTFVTPALGTPSALVATNTTGTASGLTAGNVTNVAAATTFASDLTAVPLNQGGWVEYFVSGSNFTTTSTTLVDITGLVTGTLSNSTLYEIEVVLLMLNAADSTGMKAGVHGAGTGSAATVFANAEVNSTSATGAAIFPINAVDTLSTAFMTYSGAQGILMFKGFVTTMSTGTATISIQVAKVTSNTATVKIGSVFRIRKAHT